MDCIFCGIIEGKIPANKIYEDDKFLIFLDINPINIGHALLIPKKHCSNIFDIDDDITKEVYPLLKRASVAIKSGLECDGINILQSNGDASGQVVFHSHIHIIPRYYTDGFSFESATKRKNPDRDELGLYAKKIEEKFNKIK